MNTADIQDPLFKTAVEALDAGNLAELKRLIAQHPALLRDRLVHGPPGYFQDPYLLYFVANNPIRQETMPPGSVAITAFLIGELQRLAVPSLQEQLDYTLGLLGTGRIPREAGVQLAMMDLLFEAGAKPGSGLGELAHGGVEAARWHLERGGILTLAVAVGLDRAEDIRRLAPSTGTDERLVALTVAAFYGQLESIRYLLALGVNPSRFPPPTGFHSHATPLHQAVSSSSLAAVQLLVEAGADLSMKDKIHNGTPLGWAKHLQAEDPDPAARTRYARIAEYLEAKLPHHPAQSGPLKSS